MCIYGDKGFGKLVNCLLLDGNFVQYIYGY